MPIVNRMAELQDEITKWRREIHENPGLLYDVEETAALVEEKLRLFGTDEVATGIGRTGVVGVDLWATPGDYRKFESVDICGVKWTLVDHPDHASE